MKASSNYLFLYFILIAFGQIAIAQRLPSPEVLTVDDGLCFRRVNSIIQDSKGLMWFGTSKGLSRYDGHRFVNFTKNAAADQKFKWDLINNDGLIFRNDSTLWMIADYQLVSMNINNFESKLIPGIEGKGIMFLPGKNNKIYFITDTEEQQFLWQFAEQNGFRKIDSVSHFRTHLSDINQDTSGNIWWSSTTAGLQQYDLKGSLLKVESNLEHLYFHDENTNYTDFFIDSQNRFFIYSMKKQGEYELWQYFPESGQKKILADGYKNYSFVATEDSWGNIWFGVDNKLLLLRLDGQLINYSDIFPPNHHYSSVFSIFEDNNHMLWVGTNGGIIKIPNHKQIFYNFFSKDGISWSSSIRGIGEYENGDIFFFHNDGTRGLYRIDRSSNKIIKENFGMTDLDLFNLISLATYFIYDEERNCIWAMCKSLMKLNLETNRIEIQSEASTGHAYTDYNPLAIMPNGLILIGNTLEQLALYSPESRTLKRVLSSAPQINQSNIIKALLPVDNDRFYVATSSNGIYLFNKDGTQLNHYHTDSKPAINNDHILCLHQDIQNNWLWAGTFGGGLSGIHLSTGETRTYTQQDGLSDDHVVSILSEGDNLWLGTYNGLSCFNAKQETFRNFYEEDGLTDNEFNFSSSFESKHGQMYFGGMNGVNSFNPNDLQETGSTPTLILTSYTKHDQDLDSLIYFQSNEDLKGPFVISPDISFFQFEWTLVNYINQKKTQYFTWLEGLEEGWTSLGNTPNIRFNKLPPGEYTLHLKGKSSKGNWSENPLAIDIVVLPPWWKTWWAYTLFALLSIGTIAFFWMRERRRFLLQSQLEKEHVESERLRELDETKTRLFANISHEFRTPLTIISGMADQMEENPKQWHDEGLAMIKRNSKRLLDLVNQMLDLSKLESGKMALNLQQGDIITYLKYIVESIHSFAESKEISVHFLCEENEVMMDFDQEKIHQVMVNLLSNAVKFTPEDGDIYISVDLIAALKNENNEDRKALQIKVKDTGVGISEEQLPFIFDRFYQVDDTETRHDEGTGIGLALVKELVNLMDGQISAKSNVGQDTVFTILLPIVNEARNKTSEIAFEKNMLTSANSSSTFDAKGLTSEPQNGVKPRILLVEDNADVVAYIASCLQDIYQIQVGQNGHEGIQIAFDNIPDLIITDVMMPIKDGFEVTQTLKSDERTSHIPIIMLTAKADMDSKLEGLSKGADAYLAKPFHKKELLVRIEKLLELRKNLQKHYLVSLGMASLDTAAASTETIIVEDPFGQKIKSIVESHIADYDFSVELLCREIGMSHSQLLRKLSALTGLTPLKFIRQVRLNNARTLLQNSDMSVSEAAFGSGFNDPSYFTRVFKKEFGVAPLEWKNM